MKKIKNYEDYQISCNGVVINSKGVELKCSPFNHGYSRVGLSKNNKQKFFLRHRLVAETYIPNPNNLPEVNHKDGNKLNNHVNNLEWCTCSENHLHAFKLGLHKPVKTVLGIKLGKTSNYHNVTYDPSRNKWKGHLKHNGKMYFQRRFDTEIEAAEHVNWILDHLCLTDRPRNIIK
jgi:hypothetical protein